MVNFTIDTLLKVAVSHNATDLHLMVGSPPKVRIWGTLKPLDYPILTNSDLETLLSPLLDALSRKTYQSTGELDLSYAIPSIARFRVAIYRQKSTMSAVFRVLPKDIPSHSILGLPNIVFSLAERRRGLVLVTGATGSGKSTTLASCLDIINKNQYKHIITLEQPIEYVHFSKRSNVSQREIGSDTISFTSGLRAALREDPDIILVGEMRDVETMMTAMTASETGHLVFSTLHTVGVAETINRVVNMFPESQHIHIRGLLASVLEGVVSQQLLPSKGGNGYSIAYEIMLRDKNLEKLLLDNDTEGIESFLSSSEGKSAGMCTMDDTIEKLYYAGKIDREVAIDYAVNRKLMRERLG